MIILLTATATESLYDFIISFNIIVDSFQEARKLDRKVTSFNYIIAVLRRP